MTKYKKMMPPRRTSIRGQDHLLAYITPEEAKVLKARGGSGEPGPMGIPAFDDPFDDPAVGGFGGWSNDIGTEDYGDNDPYAYSETRAGVDTAYEAAKARDLAAAQQQARQSLQRSLDIGNDALIMSGVSPIHSLQNPYTSTVSSRLNINPLGWGSSSPARWAASYFDGLGAGGLNKFGGPARATSVFAPELFSSRRVGGTIKELLANARKGRIDDGSIPLYSNWFDDPAARSAFSTMAIDKIKSSPSLGFGLPGGSQDVIEALQSGGRPVMDKYGQVQGAFTENALGLEVYTGMPVEGLPETGWVDPLQRMSEKPDDVKPVNPVTGRCDEGYVYDEELKACRLDTGDASASGDGETPEDGAYARMGLLDVSPYSLQDFYDRYGVGYANPETYNMANLDFRRRGATYPQFYDKPPQLSGYTLLA